MKSQATTREILLFTNTSFAKRELCEGYDAGRNETKKSSAEQLEKACWSGLIFEMLPGIFNRNDQKNNYVWKVSQAEQFIHIAMNSVAGSLNYETSIDPYFFLRLAIYYN